MNILGMGIVFARGRGIESFEKALNEGWRAPEEVDVPGPSGKKRLAYRVDPASISDRVLLKNMRRADKLSKMAVIAASEALASSGIENITPSPHPSPARGEGARIGIITATAFGAHVTTFDFLDDIIEYGEAGVSPTTFSNSVHNAAASYISSALGIEGPTLTVTQFFFSFHAALQLAQVWLNEKRCEYILVGAVEQYGDVLAYIHDTKLTTAPDGRIKPFNPNPTFQVPGEGSVFFLVSNDPGNSICKIGEGENLSPADLNIIDADGLLEDETIYKNYLSQAIPAAAYSPLFGSMMSGSAFDCAAGALMLKNQIMYASPVTDNPNGFNVVSETGPRSIELIRCVRYNCFSEKAEICLMKNLNR